MMLELAAVVALARQCAPTVAAETLVSLVYTESHFDPYAIGVNAKGVAAPKVSDRASAIASARSLIARGYNIDLGLGQINSANLKPLNLSIEDAFEPCRNLAASARVLAENYTSVAKSSRSTEDAIATAMSMYNTGNRWKGFANGYVGKVYASSSSIIPQIRQRAGIAMAGAPIAKAAQSPAPTPSPVADPPDQSWNTSAVAQTATLMVFGSSQTAPLKGQPE